MRKIVGKLESTVHKIGTFIPLNRLQSYYADNYCFDRLLTYIEVR